MVDGCLRHPGSSTTGSQLLDGDCYYSWQILATQPWAPMQEEETGSHHTEKQGKGGGKGVGGGGGELLERQAATQMQPKNCVHKNALAQST